MCVLVGGSGDLTGAGAGRSFGSMVTMRQPLALLVGGRMSAASRCTNLRGDEKGETQGREEVC